MLLVMEMTPVQVVGLVTTKDKVKSSQGPSTVKNSLCDELVERLLY